MFKKIFQYFLLIILSTLVLYSCKSTTSIANKVDATLTTNSEVSQNKPYVILISLDGFRWDYVEKYKPPHLTNFINNGTKAESLIPSFPSKTFPNHYTIATGMYPDKHGIIGNLFYNYKKDQTYSIGDRKTVEDGTFYGGTPIWVLADKAKMVTASFFFVGSEADVQGIRPTYYKRYDGRIQNEDRVKQAQEWLVMPPNERPHLITMYFSDMDGTGHRYGPSNEEKIYERLLELDTVLGQLFKGVDESELPVNIIIVSDHGMTNQLISKFIPIESLTNDKLFLTINNGAIVNIHPKDETQTDSVFNLLKSQEEHFKVYKTENTPGFEYTPKNRDWGTIQLIPDFGYYFSKTESIERHKKFNNTISGVHGFNPNFKDMHGIFYANGPAFKNDYTTPSVKNIHIYPLICEILGLEIPSDIDGKLIELQNILKNN